MNQKQLQYFVTVYQTQNIKTAADRLFVSRQGVSKVIRLLEEELGQPLFVRSIKGVMPTDYATILRVCQVKCVSFFRYHKRRCVTSDCWL